MADDNKIVFSYKVAGETKQGTAADFTTENIGSATEITLLEDFTAPSDADIIISSNCTLDLAGKTITTKKQIIVDDGATLTLKDSRTGGQIVNDVKPPASGFADNCKAAIQVGSTANEDAEIANFIMESGTIKAGDNGITIKGKGVAIVNDGTIISGTPEAFVEGSTIDPTGNSCVFTKDCIGSEDHYNFIMNGGTLITHSRLRATIQSQGTSTAYIHLNGGKVIREYTDYPLPPAAIYASCIGKILVSGTAELTSVTSGIEIRTGELEVTGGKITNTLDKYTLYPFGSGETTTGSSISVSQHNTKKTIKVTISGGEISGPVALSVANPQKNGAFSDSIGTVSVNITGGTFTSTSTDTERKVTRENVDFTYNGKPETVIKYTFTGKNAIFNADDRVDISISGATIEGDLATITDSRIAETITQPRTSQNGGYVVADNVTFSDTSTTPKDYSNLISYSLDENGNGIVIPDGWNYLDGWKGMITDKDNYSKIALYVDDKDVTLDDLKYDPDNKVFAVSKGITAQWSGQFAEGGGSYYLVELDYNDSATEVEVSSETESAVIRGGKSGILPDNVKTIDARYSNVALAIKGNSLDNIILDGKGNDSLWGDAGKDIFVYSAGEDTVFDYTASDKVSLDTRDLIGANSITTEDDNLVLNFDDKDKLIFKSLASLTSENTQPISGVSVESDKKLYVYTAYSVADITKGKSRSVTLNSAAGSNFKAMNSFVTIDGSAVNSALNIEGEKISNYIIAGQGGGSIDGNGGDNTLVGGKGNDIFVHRSGKNVIEQYNSNDVVNIATENITGAKLVRDKLTFVISKDNSLTFNPDNNDVEKVFLDGGGFLTKAGAVTADKKFNLFANTTSKINLNDEIYSDGVVNLVDASATKNGVTLTGNSAVSSINMASNKKKDLFEYGGGSVTISGYESGIDRIDISRSGYINLFEVIGGDVAISVSNSDNDIISLTGAQAKEIIIHDSNSSGFSKFVFAKTGVLYNKAKKPTEATIYKNADSFKAGNSIKKVFLQENVAGISIESGNNKSTLDASAANGVILIAGGKKNKFIASDGADILIHRGGKNIIENFNAASDQISLSGDNLAGAKISLGSKSIKFKFGSKNILTLKSDSKIDSLTIDGDNYTFAKNGIVKGGSVTLTSKFSGKYKVADGVTNVDGSLVEKNLTFKGTSATESLIGGTKKTTFKGGGGFDTLVGGTGKDIFFYAKDDAGTTTIANFDFGVDKLKIADSTISEIRQERDGIQFAMTNGKKNSPIGWFNVDTSKTEKDILVKANGTFYWFAKEETKDNAGNILAKAGDLITANKKVRRAQVATTGYDVIDLGYSTDLVKSKVAVKAGEFTFDSSGIRKK